MITLTEEQINTALEGLSQDVKDAFFDPSVNANLYETVKTFGVHIDVVQKIATVLFAFMLGLLPAPEFESEVKNLSGLEGERAEEFLDAINVNVLMPVREDLMSNTEETTAPRVVEPEVEKAPETSLSRVGIEVPPRVPSAPPDTLPVEKKDFLQQKLSGVTTSIKTTSDHSITKEEKQSPSNPTDPYREPIE